MTRPAPTFSGLAKAQADTRQAVGELIGKAKAAKRALTAAEEAELDGLRADEDALVAQMGDLEEDRRRDSGRQHYANVVDGVYGRSDPDDPSTWPDDRPGAARSVRNVRNVREPDLYRREGEHSFLTDVVMARGTSTEAGEEARERIRRHTAEHDLQHRDRTAANFGGLVVPAYLVEEYTTLRRSGKPTLDVIGSRPLRETGWPVSVPIETTGFTAAFAAENAASSEGDAVITETELAVTTVRGAAELSYESIHRGRAVVDSTVTSLMEAAETALNTALINGATNGPNGFRTSGNATSNVAKDDAAPSAGKVYSHILKLLTAVAENGYCMATHLIMHPRRLGLLAEELATDGRPIFEAAAMTAHNPIAVGGQGGAYGNTSLAIAGVPVVIDSAIPTTISGGGDQDTVIAFDRGNCRLWLSDWMVLEGDPQLANWTHTVVLARYCAAAMPLQPTTAGALTGTLLAV